jgi:hypothetical protein
MLQKVECKKEMTITKHDRIAIIPIRCNRLFIFEPYDIYYHRVGIEYFKQRKCLECVNKSEV